MSRLKDFLQKIFSTPKDQVVAANFGKNQRVADTLDTYLRLDKPQFAVLLQGKWGSGKTWFIREYIKKKSNDAQPFCYVSLFGIEQLIEIDSQIIACYNPILSKAECVTRFAGRIIERCNPAIKGDDIENFAKFLKKWCKIRENLILVLDDLERASISLELVLGYVSNMLNEVGIKVIILCDQEQISDENKKIFLRFKEKVIGNTITVIPDVVTVFDTQIESISNPKIKKIFQDNKERILNDFNTSKSNNLRNIKRIIYEFSICYTQMMTEMQNNDSYLNEFLHILFIFSIEINKGLSINEYITNNAKICTYYELPSCYSSIEEVPQTAKWENQISSDIIKDFLYNGIVDRTLLYDSYIKSEYSKIPEIPVKLFNKLDKNNISDSEANELYNQMKIDMRKFKYTDAMVILHAYDIMLKFSQIGIENQKEDDIVYMAKNYISKTLIRNETFKLNFFEKTYSFLSKNSPSFHEIYTAICERVTEIQQKKMNELIERTSHLLPDSPDAFVVTFMLEHPVEIKLTCLDTKDLAQRIALVGSTDLFNVMSIINDNIENICNKTSEDIKWAEELCSALEEKLDTMPLLARNILEKSIDTLKKLIHAEQQQDS